MMIIVIIMMIALYTTDLNHHDFLPDDNVDNGRIVYAPAKYYAAEILSRTDGPTNEQGETKSGWLKWNANRILGGYEG